MEKSKKPVDFDITGYAHKQRTKQHMFKKIQKFEKKQNLTFMASGVLYTFKPKQYG